MSTDPSIPPTVQLGGPDVQLVEPPALFALACGQTQAKREAMDEQQRIALDLAQGAAALRMSWPPKVKWPAPIRPRPWSPGQRAGDYGAEIFEELRKATRGQVSMASLQTACFRALTWSMMSVLTAEEVRNAGDFSEGRED